MPSISSCMQTKPVIASWTINHVYTFSAKSKGVRPKWSLSVRLAPASTRTSTLLS